MRQQFVQAADIQNAKDAAPWACIAAEVEGGWMCFESIDDYNTWTEQV